MSAAPLLARGLVCVASAEIGGQGARKPRRSATSSRLATVPDCGPPTVAEVNALAEFIARADRLLVITGAGVSTESNVPDYRSPNGAYSTGFKPMTHQEFMRSEKNQSRYWARSFAGWEEFAERTVPNAAHYALADAQKRGQVWRLITQNVDRLHHAAGSEDALELHGTTHEVICVACGDARRRRRFQLELRDANPTFAEATNASISRDSDGKQTTNEGGRPRRRPDGDVELDRDRGVGDFVVPRCRACGGGPLKPRVVFFGDAVEPGDAPRGDGGERRRGRGARRRVLRVHVQRFPPRQRRRAPGRPGGNPHQGRDARRRARGAQGGAPGRPDVAARPGARSRF